MTHEQTSGDGFADHINHYCGGVVSGSTSVAAPSGGSWIDASTGTAWETGVITTTSDIKLAQVPYSPCVGGHQADPNYAEYLDGEIATTCSVCQQRIVFRHLPGGVPFLRLKALLEGLMEGEDGDRTRALEDFAAITDALNQERAVLEAAEALAAVAKTLLEK